MFPFETHSREKESVNGILCNLRLLSLQSCMWTNPESFGYLKPKRRCVPVMHSATFGRNQAQHISTKTYTYSLSCTVAEWWWFRLVLKPQDSQCAPCSHGIDHELYITIYREHFRFNSSATEPWSLARQHIRMAEKEKKNLIVAMVQRPDLNLTEILWQDLKTAVHKPANPLIN